jgi:hypothetical protein
MKKTKPLLYINTILLFLILLAQLLSNIVEHNIEKFLTKQTHLKFISPDVGQIAIFSVKYQSISKWVSDIEPHHYISVINLNNGSVHSRSDEYIPGSLKDKYTALATKYAAWSLPEIEASKEL